MTLLGAALAQAAAVNNVAGDVTAYTDPGEAFNARPCVLIAPPVLDFTTMGGATEVTWRFIALSSYDAGQIEALGELQVLLAAIEAAVGIEQARPIRYQLAPDSTRIAAYECTVTDYLAL